MQKLVSKIISFSESETIKKESETESILASRGISIIPIDKARKEILSNITFTKLTDESYEKVFEGIEFLDRSTDMQEALSYSPKRITGAIDEIDEPEGKQFQLKYVNIDIITPYLPGFLITHNLFNFKFTKKSIETIISCKIFLVKKDFLTTLLRDFSSPIKIDSIAFDSSNLSKISIPSNWRRIETDFELTLNETDSFNVKDRDFIYLTTIATSDNSNYNYNIGIDPNYDFILLLPECSPKSVSVSNPSFIEFYQQFSSNNNIYNFYETLAEKSISHFNASKFFKSKYNEFLENFYKYNSIDELNVKLYTLKNVSAVFNCNLIQEDE